MLVVGINDVILLQWLQIESLFSKGLAELLVGVVEIQEFLLDDLDVFWVL